MSDILATWAIKDVGSITILAMLLCLSRSTDNEQDCIHGHRRHGDAHGLSRMVLVARRVHLLLDKGIQKGGTLVHSNTLSRRWTLLRSVEVTKRVDPGIEE